MTDTREKVFAIFALYDEANPESDTYLGCFTDRRKAAKAFLEVEATNRFDVVSLVNLDVYTSHKDWAIDHTDVLQGDEQ